MLEIWKGLKATLQDERAKTLKKIIIRFIKRVTKTYEVGNLKKRFQ